MFRDTVIARGLIALGLLLIGVIAVRIRRRAARIPRGLRVVITGASSGIGAELAEQYARAGARLVLAARRRDALEAVAARCRALGASTDIAPTDVTVLEDCHALAEVAAQKFNGQIDVLVLNAGIGMRGRVDEITDPTIYKRLIDTNYLGCVWVTHYLVKLVNACKGRIVVISSASGRLGVPRMAGYSGSKHALHGFFDALRCEGTNVTIVCPGFVATDMPQKNLSATGDPVGASDTVDRGRPMPVDVAARHIMEAAARGDRETILDPLTRLAATLRPLLPALVDAQLRRRMNRHR